MRARLAVRSPELRLIGALVAVVGACEPGSDAAVAAGERVSASPAGDGAPMDARLPDGLLDRPELQALVEAGLERRTGPLIDAFAHRDASVRARAAFVLGSVQDPAARPSLVRALRDREPRVRRDAAFALGQLRDPVDAPVLLHALASESDPIVRVLVAEAVGKGGDRAALLGLLDSAPDLGEDDTSWGPAVARALVHFGRRGVTAPEGGPHLVALLDTGDPRARELAAQALAAPDSAARWGVPVEEVRAALAASHRGGAGAGPLLEVVGDQGGGGDGALLATWLREAPDWRVRVAAARALGDHLRRREGAADSEALRAALDDPSGHVAVQAASSLASLPLDPEAAEAWAERVRRYRGPPTAAALLLPGVARPARAELALAWARGEMASRPPALAYPTLADLDLPEADSVLVQALAGAAGRRASYAAAAALATRIARGPLPPSVRDSVRAVAARRLSVWGPHAPGSDVRGMAALVEALAGPPGSPGEALGEAAARHPHATLRAAARRAGVVGVRETDRRGASFRPVDWVRLRSAGPRPRLRVETDRGDFTLELDVESAPATASSLLAWVEEGRFDGLPFHRVEPGFVLQSGDFGAEDAHGGPDRGLRSEFTRLRYGPGTLGMASAGKDTEGSQYFLTHGLTPSLDGRYGAVGRVVDGWPVAETVTRGDTVRRVVLLGAGGGP